MLRNRWLMLLLSGVLAMVVLAGCVATPPAAESTSGEAAEAGGEADAGAETVFRMASFEPDSLDPAIGGPGYQEYQNLYEPLVDSYGADGEIRPLAAESWTVSEDGLTYTFKLREGLMWSDGVPLTSGHFRDAWLRHIDPATASYSADDFSVIAGAPAFLAGESTDPATIGIAAPDDLTLEVTLSAPAPFFLRLVGSNAFFPIRLDKLEEFGDQWMEAGNFVGNGPYMLETWDHDQRMVMVKNPNYTGAWADTRNVDRIEYTILQDPWSMAVLPYEAGEIDVAVVPPTEYDRVINDAELSQQLQSLPIAGAVIVVFDTKNAPTDDVRVRQALAMALDYDVLANNVLRGAFEPATSFSPPSLTSYEPGSRMATNVEAAKALLAEAGYPDGAGFPAFDLYHWSLERESLLAQAMQAMWQEALGISVNLNPLEVQAMRDYRVSRSTEPFNAYIALNWAGIPDPREFHNAQLDPDGNVRHSRYDNPEYVELIRTALVETDPEVRADLYQQAEALVNQEVPILSVIYEARNWLVRPGVGNFADVTTPVAEMVRVAAPPGLDVAAE
jgi:oligopeptide transport system substrate-binding protein